GDPGYAPARINLGQVYETRGLVDSAQIQYARVLELNDREPARVADAHYELGCLDMRSGTWDGAIRHFVASADHDSTRYATYNNWGRSLVRDGRAAEGLALLRRAVARFPNVAALHA